MKNSILESLYRTLFIQIFAVLVLLSGCSSSDSSDKNTNPAGGSPLKTKEDIDRYNQAQRQLIAKRESQIIERMLDEDRQAERSQKAQLKPRQRSSEGLTEAKVRTFLSDFEHVIYRKRDTTKMAQFFSDDAVITAKTSSLAEAIVMNKRQYIEATAGTLRSVENYSYQILSRQVTLENGIATVVSRQKEKMDILGQRLELTTNDRVQVEERNGQLLITSVYAQTSDL